MNSKIISNLLSIVNISSNQTSSRALEFDAWLKMLRKWMGLMYRTISTLYFYKSQINPKMQYRCHIWAEGAHSSFSSFHKVQISSASLWLMNYFLSSKPFPKDETRSFLKIYRYLDEKYTDGLHSLVQPVLAFTAKTQRAHWSEQLITFVFLCRDINSTGADSSHEQLICSNWLPRGYFLV